MVIAQGLRRRNRGFAPQEPDAQLSTFTPGATPAASADHPGGGRRGGRRGRRGIASMMQLGAQGVQLGTAFYLSESAADGRPPRGDRQQRDGRTVLTSAISGRPARCLANTFCAVGKLVRRARCRIIRWRMISAALAAAAKARGRP